MLVAIGFTVGVESIDRFERTKGDFGFTRIEMVSRRIVQVTQHEASGRCDVALLDVEGESCIPKRNDISFRNLEMDVG